MNCCRLMGADVYHKILHHSKVKNDCNNNLFGLTAKFVTVTFILTIFYYMFGLVSTVHPFFLLFGWKKNFRIDLVQLLWCTCVLPHEENRYLIAPETIVVFFKCFLEAKGLFFSFCYLVVVISWYCQSL